MLSPGVPVSFEVNLKQPEEGMLRQEQPHTQGKKLPALRSNKYSNTLSRDSTLTTCHRYVTENLPAEEPVQHTDAVADLPSHLFATLYSKRAAGL